MRPCIRHNLGEVASISLRLDSNPRSMAYCSDFRIAPPYALSVANGENSQSHYGIVETGNDSYRLHRRLSQSTQEA